MGVGEAPKRGARKTVIVAEGLGESQGRDGEKFEERGGAEERRGVGRV